MVVVWMALMFACGTHQPPAAEHPSVASEASASQSLEVVTLQLKDRSVRIDTDQRLTLLDASGTVVLERATLSELEAIDPEAGQAVRRAQAGAHAGLAPAHDAGTPEH